MDRRLRVFGKEIVFKLESEADQSVFEEVFVDRDYRVIDDVIEKASGLIIDAGAHIGCFSVYASIQNPRAKILAYEPEERNFASLKENLKMNGCKNVDAKNLAIWKEEGEKELFLSEDSHNHSFFADGAAKKVHCTTLDKVLNKRWKDWRCELVKLDVEGAEFEILENLQKEVFEKVKVWCIEYHEYGDFKSQRLVAILQKNGLKVKIFPSRYDSRMGLIIAR